MSLLGVYHRCILSGISFLVAAGALVTAASPATAGSISVAAGDGSVKVVMEGIDFGERDVNLSLLKLGRLVTVSEARPMAPKDKCSAGNRLTLTGTTLIAEDHGGQLHDWYMKVLSGVTDRRSGSIIMMGDRNGLRRYNLFECFPTSYRRADPEDCDDSDSDLVAVDLSIGIIEIVPGKGNYASAHNWKIEIDGCVSGGACPGVETDEVASADFKMDASALFPGGSIPQIDAGKKLYVGNLPYSNSRAICAWILRCQGQASVCRNAALVQSSQRGNGNSAKKSSGGKEVRIVLSNLQILSVILPTFDFNTPPTDSNSHAVEEVEFVVEKVERG